VRAQRLRFVCGCFQEFLAASGQIELRALCGKRERDGFADAATRSRDDRNLAFQIFHGLRNAPAGYSSETRLAEYHLME
jgi:hypothetical protein